MAEHEFRTEFYQAGAAGMIPVRRARLDLQPIDRRAAGFERCDRIGLGVEDADRGGVAVPVATAAGEPRGAAPHAGGDTALPLRRIVLIGAGNLEQRDVAVAAIGIAPGGGDQSGQQRGPHVGHVGGDRVGELQLGPAAAEQFGVPCRNERPCQRLHHAACGKRAPGSAGSHLQCGQDFPVDRVMAGQRLRRDFVHAMHAHHLLDQIGLAVDIGPP